MAAKSVAPAATYAPIVKGMEISAQKKDTVEGIVKLELKLYGMLTYSTMQK